MNNINKSIVFSFMMFNSVWLFSNILSIVNEHHLHNASNGINNKFSFVQYLNYGALGFSTCMVGKLFLLTISEN